MPAINPWQALPRNQWCRLSDLRETDFYDFGLQAMSQAALVENNHILWRTPV